MAHASQDMLYSRLCFNTKTRFPLKLFHVANDGVLVKWNSNGTSILVNEDTFEQEVMKYYPGFVKIASFVNFRRLFREYSFDWRIVEGTENLFEFSHPSFVRGGMHLLGKIKTKRKSVFRSFLRASNLGHPLAASSPKGFVLRRRYKYKRNQRLVSESDSSLTLEPFSSDPEPVDNACSNSLWSKSNYISENRDLETRSSFCPETSDVRSNGSHLQRYHPYSATQVLDAIESSTDAPLATRPTQQDLSDVLAVYAENELTEEEFLQLLASKAVQGALEDVREVTGDWHTLQSSSREAEEFTPLYHTVTPEISWMTDNCEMHSNSEHNTGFPEGGEGNGEFRKIKEEYEGVHYDNVLNTCRYYEELIPMSSVSPSPSSFYTPVSAEIGRCRMTVDM